MKLTYTLLFLFLFSKSGFSQRAIIQDTFYYKNGEMIVGKMFQEENLGQITVYVKTPEGKNKKIRKSKVVSYVRGGTNERYVKLKVPKKWIDKPSIEKAFFREMLNNPNGISIYWVDHTQPQFDRVIPLVLPVPGGILVGVATMTKDVSQSYYYMKEGELFRIEEDDQQYQKLLEKITNDCPNIQENVDKKIYSSKDIWKFAKDFNSGCK
jgi:hypothetical protein